MPFECFPSENMCAPIHPRLFPKTWAPGILLGNPGLPASCCFSLPCPSAFLHTHFLA